MVSFSSRLGYVVRLHLHKASATVFRLLARPSELWQRAGQVVLAKVGRQVEEVLAPDSDGSVAPQSAAAVAALRLCEVLE